MRIITGSAKGRIIKSPKGMTTRPTSDRTKESIFNILSNNIYDSKVLDMFAGTGNLGLESISRGASICTFIETDKLTFKILVENISELGFNDKSESYNHDAFSVLKTISSKGVKYDLIFLDPPYGRDLITGAVKAIADLNLLEDDGIIVCEYDETDRIDGVNKYFKTARTEKYGRTRISFLTKEE